MGKPEEEILKIIASDPDKALNILNMELSLPNIPTQTAGGETFWNTLAEHAGWRLQQNMITKHARILRPDDVRVAWGTVNGMYKALERLAPTVKPSHTSAEDSNAAVEKLKKLKELLDMGAITPEEYNKKKAELMDLI